MTNDLSSSLVSLAFFFSVWNRRTFFDFVFEPAMRLITDQSMFTRALYFDRIWTPHICGGKKKNPTSISIITWIRDGKCPIFLTLVQ